jgi:tetratricopeptide (TPR) repeat protein
VAANPDYWEARSNLAVTLIKVRRYAEAADELIKVLRAQPQLPAVHKQLGDLYFEHLKDWGKARQHYEIYLRFSPPRGKERKEVQARLLKIAQS